jgi:hypothetical protein
MNNSSIFTADRMTHLKIVVVSLIASIAVLAVGISARMGSDPTTLQASTAPVVVKAGKPMMVTTTGAGSAVR